MRHIYVFHAAIACSFLGYSSKSFFSVNLGKFIFKK